MHGMGFICPAGAQLGDFTPGRDLPSKGLRMKGAPLAADYGIECEHLPVTLLTAAPPPLPVPL